MAAGPDQAVNPPAVLLTGASSQIGVFAIPRLVKAGFRVVAVSRKGRPARVPDFEQVQWATETNACEAARPCRFLLSAGPLDLAKRFLLACDYLEQAVVFSSTSVASKQASVNPAERAQIRDMQVLESELQSIAESRGLRLAIFRPTLIYGCGMDTNISLLAAWIKRFGFMPVNGKAEGLRQPVHADDLAAVSIGALKSREKLPFVMNLCGGETLSYAEMVSRIFAAMGKPARLLHMPEWLFVVAVNIAGLVRPGSGLNGEMVRRQRLDLVFDDREARELLAYDPRPFRPALPDFSMPEFK